MSGEFFFDDAAADLAVEFFSTVLRHSVGEWAGKRFVLEKWQRDEIVRPLFGWKRSADGTRRYRMLWLEVPRKNGKSTLVAGIGLFLLFFDGEPSAEIYSAAADVDQAAIIHASAKAMVLLSRQLTRRARVFRDSIVVPATGSFYRVLSNVPGTKHGFNPHGVLFDEVHTQRNRALWDVLTSGSGARRQPLIVAATTAGVDRHSICWELHDHALKASQGIIEDPSLLSVIYAADAERERKDAGYWKSEKTWRAANPNYGISVKPDYLRDQALKATANAAAENSFKRLYLNIWTEQVTRWLQMDRWDECADPVPAEELAGRPCWAGLDLGSTSDLCALSLVFPPPGVPAEPVPGERVVSEGDSAAAAPARWDLLLRYWVPEATAAERERRDRVPYGGWIKQGLIEATPGDVTDYDFIRARICELAAQFDIRELGYDPWNATQLATQLAEQDGITTVEVRQGARTLSEPAKFLAALVLTRALRHGGNAVLRWNAANVAIREDANGNIRPDKQASTERIDGIVATIIALSRATVSRGTVTSVYETKSLMVL